MAYNKTVMKRTFIFTVILAVSACFAVFGQEVKEVDLTRISDGVYKGKCRYYGMFTCEVEVEVKDHRITDIKVFEGRESEYVEAAKGVTKNVIREQSLKVDAVTGATVTSNAILRAIENALTEKGR